MSYFSKDLRGLVSKRAALIAIVAAIPFVAVATYYLVQADLETRWPVDAIVYRTIGTAIFLLGSPLTLIYMVSMPYIGRFLMWSIGSYLEFLVVPVYVLLFISQWIIWSQLIVIAWRRIMRHSESS